MKKNKKNKDKKKSGTVYCCGIVIRKGKRCQICGEKY